VHQAIWAYFDASRHGHGYENTTAKSAVDAFRLLRQERFDLILLDIVLPAAGEVWRWHERPLGLGLIKRCRELGVTTPVILMTAGGWGTPALEVEPATRAWRQRPRQASRLGRADDPNVRR
jgi:CheY-like chemotaxis protein